MLSSATSIYKYIQFFCTTLLKECKLHIYCAAVRWVHNHNKADIVLIKSRIEDVMKAMLLRVLVHHQTSKGIVELPLLVKMLETEYTNIKYTDHQLPQEASDVPGLTEKTKN